MSKNTISATLEGGRILIKWGYRDDYKSVIENLKTYVSGARFRKADKIWAAPVSVDNCHGLREAFGDELKIGRPLREWYVAHAAEAAQHEEASAATDAELLLLPTVAPRLFATLRPDQRAGVRWIADGYRDAGLIADKPGLGKTMQLIGGVLEAGIQGNILVVCPKISVWNVWRREIRKWTDESVHVCRGTRAKREAALQAFLDDPSERKWLVIVAEMLRVKRKPNETSVKANAKKRGRVEGFEFSEIFEQPWSVVACDESHRMLGSLTIAKSNLMGEGLASLSYTEEGRRYAISGTPFGKGGRIQGMFGTLHWLWPDEYTAFWRWAGRYFDIEEEYIGRGKTAKKIKGLKDGLDNEKFLKTLGPRILRRTKEEVLPNLPPKQYIEVSCEMEPKQLRQYKQLGDDAEIDVDGGVIMANGVLAELTRAKQVANGVLIKRGDKVGFTGESCKMDRLMANLETRGILDDSGDGKLIISSRYNQFIYDVIIPRLEEAGVDYYILTGKTNEKKRDDIMDEFQADGGARVFILNSKAGGVSITLDAADEVHCMDEMDNPEDNEQLEDRAHRASRIHQVTIYYYRTEGTIDFNIAESVEDKRQAQFEVLDGRRGIEDVRNWIKYREEA